MPIGVSGNTDMPGAATCSGTKTAVQGLDDLMEWGPSIGRSLDFTTDTGNPELIWYLCWKSIPKNSKYSLGHHPIGQTKYGCWVDLTFNSLFGILHCDSLLFSTSMIIRTFPSVSHLQIWRRYQNQYSRRDLCWDPRVTSNTLGQMHSRMPCNTNPITIGNLPWSRDAANYLELSFSSFVGGGERKKMLWP